MSIHQHLAEFGGKPVQDWFPGSPLPDLAAVTPRLRVEDQFEQEGGAAQLVVPMLDAFVAAGGGATDALVIGCWGEPYDNGSDPIIEALVRHAPSLGSLRSLFVGDIIMEECEISWIEQSDVTPILLALPELVQLGIRGGTSLVLRPVRHDRLRSLVIQTGGLPSSVVRALGASNLTALQHLELWLGDENYGNDISDQDLDQLLATTWPIEVLALRNAEQSDAVAAAVCRSSMLERIQVLDLSLGNLGDVGAETLLATPQLLGLRRLDVHHHYLSPAMVDRLLALPIQVDASDRNEPEHHQGTEYRSIFVAE